MVMLAKKIHLYNEIKGL